MALIKSSFLSIFYLTFLMERVIPMDPDFDKWAEDEFNKWKASISMDESDGQHVVEGVGPNDNQTDNAKWAQDELNKWKASIALDESDEQHVVEVVIPNDNDDCFAQWLQYEINYEKTSESFYERKAFAFSNPNYTALVMTDNEFGAFSDCKKELYDFFNWGSKFGPHRDTFPKKAFLKMKYDSFKKDGEPEKVIPKRFYHAVLDDLCAKPNTLNVEQWCAAQLESNTVPLAKCMEELGQYFVFNGDASKVLRNAYYCIVESRFVSKSGRPYSYYRYLYKQMDYKPTVQGFRTPYEFCTNSPAIVETKDMSNKGDKPQTGNMFKPSSSNFPSDDLSNSDR